MVYTVTFNPSLDYIVSVADFKLGFTNRTDSELMLPGGKGLNVSMVLGNLGVENTAFGFAAGFTGEEIIRRAEEMGVKTDFIRIEEGISRINLKLKTIDGTEINGCGPKIGQRALEELVEKLDVLKEEDVLVLAGSIPGSVPDDIYKRIMKRMSGRGIKVVVDATKDLLLNVLEYRPFLVKPNNYELGEMFGCEIKTREEAIPFARKLREMGAANVLVSMAGNGAAFAAADGTLYDTPAPVGKLVNGVGAGDSMVAGFLAGWLEKKDYMHAFLMGVSAGSASAFSEFLATRKEIEAVYRQMTRQ